MNSESYELTQRIITYAKTVDEWENAGADIIKIIPTERYDSTPSYEVPYMDGMTKKTYDYMEGTKSIIVLGFHAWDDMCEALTVKNGHLEAFGYTRVGYVVYKLRLFIESLGYTAKRSGDFIPKKKLAVLAGIGNYGKNSLIISPKYGPWIRLAAILTNAELEYDDAFTEGLCGDCEECVKACPTGAISHYRVYPERCLVSPSSKNWVDILDGNLSFEDCREVENGNQLFEEHSPVLTKNTRLMCMTCQLACPYGKEERGLVSKN
jgi:epoxyqueuosine reductase QueG